MSAAVKSLIPPSLKSFGATREAIESATLSTIGAAALQAAGTLKTMASAASGVKASLTRALLHVIAKETVFSVAQPVKDVCANAGASVSNLSTIRSALVKMAVTYGSGIPAANTGDSEKGENTFALPFGAPVGESEKGASLPVWETVSDAKASGDAAMTAVLQAAVTSNKDGAYADPIVFADIIARVNAACALFALSDDSMGKLRGVYQARLSELCDMADAEKVTSDDKGAETAQIVADATATVSAELDALRAEVESLRAIAAEARRILALPEDNTAALCAMAEMESATLTDAA